MSKIESLRSKDLPNLLTGTSFLVKKMIADLGTRKGASIKDVNGTSAWFNGYSWIREDL